MAAKPRSAAPVKPSTERVRKHRDALRAKGLRPIQLWVPDMKDPAFLAECARQAKAIAASPNDKEDQEFIDSIAAIWQDDEWKA
jgi:hypothetical protein